MDQPEFFWAIVATIQKPAEHAWACGKPHKEVESLSRLGNRKTLRSRYTFLKRTPCESALGNYDHT